MVDWYQWVGMWWELKLKNDVMEFWNQGYAIFSLVDLLLNRGVQQIDMGLTLTMF